MIVHLRGDVMARSKSEDKRALILQASKTLFARKGFFNASISDIVKETGLPVGSLYTYFKNKEEIVKVIIDEGWEEIHARLQQNFLSTKDPQAKLMILLDVFLPELFEDLDLITILLGEAVDYTKLEEKLEELTTMIFSILKALPGSNDFAAALSQKDMETALIVYFLGLLHTARLAKSTPINITLEDIIRFVKITIKNAMNVDI
jgi:AcrR family transcriptional regulator